MDVSKKKASQEEYKSTSEYDDTVVEKKVLKASFQKDD